MPSLRNIGTLDLNNFRSLVDPAPKKSRENVASHGKRYIQDIGIGVAYYLIS